MYGRKSVGGRVSEGTLESVTSGSRRALFDAFREEDPCREQDMCDLILEGES